MTPPSHLQWRAVNESKLLTGMRVVVFALNLPGPAAGARLAANGASVVKIEPAVGDRFAATEPEFYREVHAGVEILRVDLRGADARAALEQQLAHADVFITAFRPASLERLALDAASIRAKFPRLCHVAIVGQSGAEGDIAGHDLTYQAASGLLFGGAMPSTLIADLVGIERAVSATFALLLARANGSHDLYAEVALADGAHDFAGPLRLGLTTSTGVLGGTNPFYSIYQTNNGLLALAVLEEKFWRRLLQLLPSELHGIGMSVAERESVLALNASSEELRGLLEQLFMLRSAAEWEGWGRVNDLPMTAVRQSV